MTKNITITREFIFGGHAIFTVQNPDGKHHTYKVEPPATQKDPKKPIYFVSALIGPDNTADYSYLGLLKEDGTLLHTGKSSYKATDETFKVASWAIKIVLAGKTIPEGYAIRHLGTCGKCGRPLTHPESLDTGIGPICAKRS